MALAETDITPDALPLDSIVCGDALDVLRGLPDNSLDSIVTDPPAGISFMGKGWDSNKGGRDQWIAWLSQVMAEALRVLKPGGHALVWALPRTSHWTAMALEDAGFEVRDCVTHLFGSGFPKSLDVSKAIDKAAGAKGEEVWYDRYHDGKTRKRQRSTQHVPIADGRNGNYHVTPATDAARAWDGWGTALKPAAEFWWLCRKPLSEPTVAANVLTWGTGALNIDGSRIRTDEALAFSPALVRDTAAPFGKGYAMGGRGSTQGRWPANLLLSHSLWCDETACALDCPVRALDAQVGTKYSRPSRIPGTPRQKRTNINQRNVFGGFPNQTAITTTAYDDIGAPSRYFSTFRYTPKASRAERNRGCSDLPSKAAGGLEGRRDGSLGKVTMAHNIHPTVKPLALMSWLIGLITPPGGIVLDPFAGSGSTLCAAKAGGWRYIGVEKDSEYVAIARARVQAS